MDSPAAPSSESSADAPAAAPAGIGVLLVNLGTPEAPDPRAVRAYLREFLSDRRVIEASPLLWQPVLHGVVLRTRPRRVARAYATVWNRAENESPLLTITRAQAEKLAARLAGAGVAVEWAMRYGRRSIATGLATLAARGCRRILVAPLYPQYSATTTASACDAVFAALERMRDQPALRVLPPYFADPLYIGALAGAIREGIAALPFVPERLVASFHGLPRAYVDKGDPYERQCEETVRLLRAALGWDADRLVLSYQSRFGPTRWLAPATADTVAGLARSGVKSLAVVTPGFAADCLETLEEIAIGAGERFRAAGGENFAALPCLNDAPAGMSMLEALVRRELAGWL
ncbi:MAG TPA: ferrochelatase [Hyphomicrobiales bacterium]|nr:ferrochelatase [Hyphomicrobiales bacterium]